MKLTRILAIFLCLTMLLGTPAFAEEITAAAEAPAVEAEASAPQAEAAEASEAPAPAEALACEEPIPEPEQPEAAPAEPGEAEAAPADAAEATVETEALPADAAETAPVQEPAPAQTDEAAPDADAQSDAIQVETSAPEAEASAPEVLVSETAPEAPVPAGEVVLEAAAVEAEVAAETPAAEQTVSATPTREMKAGKNGSYRLAMGSKLQLTAVAAISAGWKITSVTSSNKKVASVSKKGLITGKKAGKVTITIKVKKGRKTLKGTLTVTVFDPRKATSVKLTPKGTVNVPLGTKLQLTATLSPATAVSKLTWKTSSKKIAKVSSSGVVTPVKKGTCTITVKTNTGKTAKVKIKVVAAQPVTTTTVEGEQGAPVALTTEQQDLIADLSHYDGTIDWDTAREILDFTILRSSCGLTTDTKYVYNAQNCNIPFGVYHYVKAGNAEDAAKEAEYFYKSATVSGIAPRFFVADVEYKTQTSDTTKEVCDSFLGTLRSLGASMCGLYIGQSKYPYTKSMEESIDFLWMPRYGKDDATAKDEYQPIYPCDLWQYTSTGYVPGVSGGVDLSLLHGSKKLSFFTGAAKVDTSTAQRLTVTSATLSVRAGAGSKYTELRVAQKGEKLVPVFNSSSKPIQSNGWYAVRVGQQVGWVSGEFVTLK